MSINDLIALLEKRQVASRADLVGVSESEIVSLEAHFDLSFPRTYRDYLTAFGRSAGNLSTWMAIYFDDLKEIQEEFEFQKACRELVFTMPDSTLLISNMGTMFDYFHCNGKDDPMVFRLDLKESSRPSGELYAQSFSEYLNQLINCAHSQPEVSQFYVDVSGNMCDGELSKQEDLGEDLLIK